MSRAKIKYKKERQKKLIIVFAISFVSLFVFFSWLSSVLTPEMNNPILDNSEEEIVEVSSNDFKGRVDSRLKFIEFQDNNPSEKQEDKEKEEETKEDSEQTTEKEKEASYQEIILETAKKEVAEAEKEANKFVKLLEKREEDRSKQNELAKVEYEKQASSDSLNIQSEIDKSKISTVKLAEDNTTVQAVQKSSSNAPAPPLLPLRGKVKPVSLVKVLVGSYKTREEAKKNAEKLGKTILEETPFVKELNGRFALQAGSFKNPEAARDFSQELKEHNLYVRIIKE